ncbi:metal-dependent phosphohydrolase [Halobacteriales archaeon QS_9_68_17]|nr:MAG: metal-dependent phosphohydrolase [Halobacteriales archaeon QS_9_68_17]
MADRLGDDSTGHDMDHAWRVFDLGVRIAEPVGADVEVVGAAALTHDVHRAMGESMDVHPEGSLDEVRAVLSAAGYPEEKVAEVLDCVKVHDEYEFRGVEHEAESVEAEVLRDADDLDATGAVDTVRTFAFGGVAGHRPRDPDGEEYSALDRFDEKLLQPREERHTAAARAFAEERHDSMAEFVERSREEWRGEL